MHSISTDLCQIDVEQFEKKGSIEDLVTLANLPSVVSTLLPFQEFIDSHTLLVDNIVKAQDGDGINLDILTNPELKAFGTKVVRKVGLTNIAWSRILLDMVAKTLSDNISSISRDKFTEVVRMAASLPLVKEALICTFRPDPVQIDNAETDLNGKLTDNLKYDTDSDIKTNLYNK